VQRRFTKQLHFLNSMSYSQRLISLDLESLEVRRLRQDLLLRYKIVFGLINIDSSKIFTLRHNIIVLYVGTVLNCFYGLVSENQRVVGKRLISLDLESLEVRRLGQDLLLRYKIVFGLINIDSSIFLHCDVIVLHVGTVLNCFLVTVGLISEKFLSACCREME